MIAPIILFVYNRLDHTRKTVEALQKNELASESILYVFADGVKENANPEQIRKVQGVREYVRGITGFKDIIIEEAKVNKGLADSIVEGVTRIVNQFGKVIVLEDDIVTSPGFLRYMNDALSLYENEPRVMHIAGYLYPLKKDNLPETFFYPAASCWGWSTWKRAWSFFNSNASVLYEQLEKEKKMDIFNINKIHDFQNQLLANIDGSLHTWFIKWHASVVLANGFCLYPHKSLVQNVGFDNSGEHCGEAPQFFIDKLVDHVCVEKQKIEFNRKAIKYLKQFPDDNISSWSFDIKSKIKEIVRSRFFRLFPELRVCEQLQDIQYGGCDYIVRNSLHKSNISKKAKIYPKYELKEAEIGDYSYVARNSHIQKTKIGKFCSLGPNLVCGWGIHPTDGISTHPMFYSTMKQNGVTLSAVNKVEELKPITIGNDVFIGANVTILDGVTIGDGAVIGAGAVVSKDIPPYAIAVGCPIKVIRYRFPDDTIEKLKRIEWWNFDDEKLKEVERYFFDVESFVEKYI